MDKTFSIEKDYQKTFSRGKKYDETKPMMQLLPMDALYEISKILTFGANKYGAHNWRGLENGIERYQGAMLRHLTAYTLGEKYDEESNMHHLSHLACNALFMLSMELDNLKKDENKNQQTRI